MVPCLIANTLCTSTIANFGIASSNPWEFKSPHNVMQLSPKLPWQIPKLLKHAGLVNPSQKLWQHAV